MTDRCSDWTIRQELRFPGARSGERVVSLMSKYLNAALVVDRDNDRVITVEWLH
jgi:hypothetical protein